MRIATKGKEFAFRAFLQNAQGATLSPWHDLGLLGKETDKFTAFFEIARY